MRGLKLANRLNQLVVYNVASFTDAWIETIVAGEDDPEKWVASFTDAWIET